MIDTKTKIEYLEQEIKRNEVLAILKPEPFASEHKEVAEIYRAIKSDICQLEERQHG